MEVEKNINNVVGRSIKFGITKMNYSNIRTMHDIYISIKSKMIYDVADKF